MVGAEISDVMKKRIINDILYKGLSQRETVTETGTSLETVNKYWQEFVDEVLHSELDNVLESKGMPDTIDMANTTRQMHRFGITPADCNRALPVVGICRRLGLDPQLIPELIESAIRFGQPAFSAAEYASAIARIHRREKQTGLTVEQVDAVHQAATVEVNGLQAESSRLQNIINGQQNTVNSQQNTLTNLRNQSSRLTEELQEKQRRVSALDTRIASEGTTLQELNTYAADKPYLIDLGLDVRKVQRVRSVFTTLAAFNYDPARIIDAINQVGNLQAAIQNLLNEVRGKQKEVQDANDAKEIARREIQDLQEKKKDEEKRVDQAKREADRKIAELQENLNNQMRAADVTEKLLAEYVENREKLRTWGVEL